MSKIEGKFCIMDAAAMSIVSCVDYGQCTVCRDYQSGKTPPMEGLTVPLEFSPERYSPQRLVDYACIRMARISYGDY